MPPQSHVHHQPDYGYCSSSHQGDLPDQRPRGKIPRVWKWRTSWNCSWLQYFLRAWFAQALSASLYTWTQVLQYKHVNTHVSYFNPPGNLLPLLVRTFDGIRSLQSNLWSHKSSSCLLGCLAIEGIGLEFWSRSSSPFHMHQNSKKDNRIKCFVLKLTLGGVIIFISIFVGQWACWKAMKN